MAGKVFISCGQRGCEVEIASKLSKWLESVGYSPYIAIEAQSIQDVNSGIIDELERSDFYIFIDFRRDKIDCKKFQGVYRGSLFTNQELAIAYYLKFEKAIFFQQNGILREGLLKYMASNATEFSGENDLLEKVQKAVKDRERIGGWNSAYSRHLIAGRNNLSNEISSHRDHLQNIFNNCKILQKQIINNRDDKATLHSAARLEKIKFNGIEIPVPDRTLLKATDLPSFDQPIWPKSYCTFDLLLISRNEPMNLYLMSAFDSVPRQPIISRIGNYELVFSVIADGFPLLMFNINIVHNGNFDQLIIT